MATKLEKVKLIDGEICISGEEIGKLFSVTVQAIGQWSMEGMPKAATGYYPLQNCMKWYEKSSHFIVRSRQISEATQNTGNLSDSERKLKAEAELKQLQAEAQDIKNCFSRGDYLLREDVVKVLSAFFAALKRSFHSFGRTTSIYLSPFVDEATSRKMDNDYRLMIDDFLRRISEGANYADSKKVRKAVRR